MLFCFLNFAHGLYFCGCLCTLSRCSSCALNRTCSINYLALSTCGQTIRENGTYFVNAGYPDGLNATGTCQVTVHKLSPYICQFRQDVTSAMVLAETLANTWRNRLFRLDFERFSVTGPEPVNHQCDNDQFIVSGSNPVPVICGMNTGSHSMYHLE